MENLTTAEEDDEIRPDLNDSGKTGREKQTKFRRAAKNEPRCEYRANFPGTARPTGDPPDESHFRFPGSLTGFREGEAGREIAREKG